MMRRLILTGLLLVLGTIGGVTPLAGMSHILYGDANQDGTINVLDITTTELIIAGAVPPTQEADCDHDADVDDGDLACTINLIATQ
jgi:hypothetical protein